MREAPVTLINETSDLLEEIIPILNRNIQMLQDDFNPQGGAVQYLLKKEIELQQSLLQRAKELNDNLMGYLKPKPINVFPRSHVGDLKVIMQNGKEICHRYVSDTFVEAIQIIGIEKVKLLGMEYCDVPLISTFKHHTYNQAQSGSYYIMTNSNTDKKIEQLKEIKRRLNLEIEVIDNRK